MAELGKSRIQVRAGLEGVKRTFTPNPPRFLQLLFERLMGRQEPDQEVPSRVPQWRQEQDPMPQWRPQEPMLDQMPPWAPGGEPEGVREAGSSFHLNLGPTVYDQDQSLLQSMLAMMPDVETLQRGAQRLGSAVEPVNQFLQRPDVASVPFLPQTGGMLFRNPIQAAFFRDVMENPMFTAGGTGQATSVAKKQLPMIQALLDRMMLRSGIAPETMGPNIVNSVIGQTFGKGGILPFSGAAHKIPRQAMSSEALLAAMLSGVIP